MAGAGGVPGGMAGAGSGSAGSGSVAAASTMPLPHAAGNGWPGSIPNGAGAGGALHTKVVGNGSGHGSGDDTDGGVGRVGEVGCGSGNKGLAVSGAAASAVATATNGPGSTPAPHGTPPIAATFAETSTHTAKRPVCHTGAVGTGGGHEGVGAITAMPGHGHDLGSSGTAAGTPLAAVNGGSVEHMTTFNTDSSSTDTPTPQVNGAVVDLSPRVVSPGEAPLPASGGVGGNATAATAAAGNASTATFEAAFSHPGAGTVAAMQQPPASMAQPHASVVESGVALVDVTMAQGYQEAPVGPVHVSVCTSQCVQ